MLPHATVLPRARTLGRLVHFVQNSFMTCLYVGWFPLSLISVSRAPPLSLSLSPSRARSISRSVSGCACLCACACACMDSFVYVRVLCLSVCVRAVRVYVRAALTAGRAWAGLCV